MALIVRDYLDHFVINRQTMRHFNSGEVSYFDPQNRCFLRINPTKGEVPQDHWIPLPVIRYSEVLKNFLRETGRTEILQKYSDLDELDFSDAILKLWETNGDHDLGDYVTRHHDEVLSKWIEENQIPNCKLRYGWTQGIARTREEAMAVMEYRKKIVDSEMLQEEEFKKSLLK